MLQPRAWVRESQVNNCMEVMWDPDEGLVTVRNSKSPDGPAVSFTREEWAEAQKGFAKGTFDIPA